MRKVFLIVLLTIVFCSQMGFAQQGKISGYMFGDYYYMAAHHDSAVDGKNGFWFRRIYFGYDRKLNENFSVRLRTEMAHSGDFISSSTAVPFVKDAYLSWKLGKTTLLLGISPTPTWSVVEKTWGYRSVEKTAVDLQKFASSRDFGIAIKGNLSSDGKIQYHAMIGNGNSNKSETNEGKKVMLSLSFYPTKKITIEVYGDWNNNPGANDWATLQGFVAYQTGKARFGLQYARQSRNVEDGADLNLSLGSLFCVATISDNTSLFARVDRMFDPNPIGHKISYIPFDNTAKSTFLVAGLDFAPHKDVHLMPNVEVVVYDKNDAGVKPDTDLIPRFTLYYKF